MVHRGTNRGSCWNRDCVLAELNDDLIVRTMVYVTALGVSFMVGGLITLGSTAVTMCIVGIMVN